MKSMSDITSAMSVAERNKAAKRGNMDKDVADLNALGVALQENNLEEIRRGCGLFEENTLHLLQAVGLRSSANPAATCATISTVCYSQCVHLPFVSCKIL
jgi:hypothetical protein